MTRTTERQTKMFPMIVETIIIVKTVITTARIPVTIEREKERERERINTKAKNQEESSRKDDKYYLEILS